MQSLPLKRSKRTASGIKTIGECAPVAALKERARALNALDQRLRQPLPAALRDQCRLANVRAGRIVFLASSSTWAAKLRLYHTALLTEARVALGPKIEKLTVKVALLPPVPPVPAKSKPLSETTAEHLTAAAKSISDPELKTLYLQLASLADISSSR